VAPPAPSLPTSAKHQILRGDADRELARDREAQRPHPPRDQRLADEDMLHFGGADTEPDRAERTIGRSMAVGAGHGHARLDEPLLRPDDMGYSLTRIADREQGHAERPRIALQRLDLQQRARIGIAVLGQRRVVVDHRQRRRRPAHASA
jgi:hypothetical protein